MTIAILIFGTLIKYNFIYAHEKKMCMWWLTAYISTVDRISTRRQEKKNEGPARVKIGTYKIEMLIANWVLNERERGMEYKWMNEWEKMPWSQVI